MIAFPPFELVADKLRDVVAPAFACSVILIAPFLVWRRGQFAPIGAVLALVGGIAAGNYYTVALPWKAGQSSWGWLLLTTLIVLVVGLISRLPQFPGAVRWLLRMSAAGFAAWFVFPEPHTIGEKLVIAAIILVEWALLETLCLRLPGGAGPFAAAMMFFAAAAILIHAGWAGGTDAAGFVGSALLGIGVAASLRRADVSTVMPAVAVTLFVLLTWGQNDTYSKVPTASFIVAGLSPLALLPMLLPMVQRAKRRRQLVIGFVLLVIPLALAVGMAMEAETLQYH